MRLVKFSAGSLAVAVRRVVVVVGEVVVVDGVVRSIVGTTLFGDYSREYLTPRARGRTEPPLMLLLHSDMAEAT
jgi:hypothetical protein